MSPFPVSWVETASADPSGDHAGSVSCEYEMTAAPNPSGLMVRSRSPKIIGIASRPVVPEKSNREPRPAPDDPVTAKPRTRTASTSRNRFIEPPVDPGAGEAPSIRLRGQEHMMAP